MSQSRGKYRQTENPSNYCIGAAANPGWVLLSVIITTSVHIIIIIIIIAATSARTSLRSSLIIYQWETLDARKGRRMFAVILILMLFCVSVQCCAGWCPSACVIIVLIIPLIVSSVLLMTEAVQYVSITSPVSSPSSPLTIISRDFDRENNIFSHV